MQKIAAVLVCLLATTLGAQPLTVGSQPVNAIFGLSGAFATTAPWSIIDVAHPASANGTVNRASVNWSFGCTGAFKLAFLRRTGSPTQFTVVAVRGPFDSVAGRAEVVLSPAVPLQEGDLMALIQVKPGTTCGSPLYEQYPRGQSAVWVTLSDISATGTLPANATLEPEIAFAVKAYNADPVLVRVLPAAGAVQGAGAFFRTSLQLHNLSVFPISGKLVFHRAGTPGSAGDPTLPFTVGYRQTLSFPDVVASMGTSGLGSLDVFTNGGAELVVSARVFSDGGAAGTSGFTEDGLDPELARRNSISGVLLLPSDLTNFRMNIGIRTLQSGARISAFIYDANGVLAGTKPAVDYPPDYFEQPTASQFTGLATLPAGGSIVVNVSTGAAFIYGSITDNRTSDSSMRMAEKR